MIENIIDAYDRYNSTAENECVIIIKPDAYYELMQECYELVYYSSHDMVNYIGIEGRKIPIIVDVELPWKTQFVIMSRAEYERKEQDKLLKRIAKKFKYKEGKGNE